MVSPLTPVEKVLEDTAWYLDPVHFLQVPILTLLFQGTDTISFC